MTIPKHLEDILEIRPSGYEKLKLVFHDLTIENQILILDHKKNHRNEIAYLLYDFYLEAIKSKNSYIRYLVASSCYFGMRDDDSLIKLEKIIKNDKNELVRNSLLEKDTVYPIDNDDYIIDKFLSHSQSERLALVRKISSGLDTIVDLFKELAEALKKEKISEVEIFEIFYEFSTNKELTKNLMHGYELREIMKTASLFPDNISSVLMSKLPEPLYREEDLDKLSQSDVEKLMEREDFKEKPYRQKYFLKKINKFINNFEEIPEDEIHSRLIDIGFCKSSWHNFSLTEEIVETIINLKKEHASVIIENLINISSIELAEVIILQRILRNHEIPFSSTAIIGENKKLQKIEDGISQMIDDRYNKVLADNTYRSIRNVYAAHIARIIVDKTETLTEEPHKSFNRYLEEGNLYKTYLNIIDTWSFIRGKGTIAIIKNYSYLYNFYKLEELLEIEFSKTSS